MRKKGLIIGSALIAAFCFAIPVESDSFNEVTLSISERLMVDTDSDVINPGKYSAAQALSVDLFNGKDDSEKSLKKITLTLKPNEPEGVKETQANNLDLLSRNPAIGTGEDIQEEQNASLTLIMKGEEEVDIPLEIVRQADRTYFEGVENQTVGLKVIHNSPEVKKLSIGILLTGFWVEGEAEIKFISASREHFQGLSKGSEGESVNFSVANPVEGQEYYFTAQVEVTPLQGQVTYLPSIWVEAVTKEEALGQVRGKVFEKQTDSGSVKGESTEELLFSSEVSESLMVLIFGVGARERLDLETPALSFPETPEGAGWLSNINWELIGLAFAVLSAIASVAFAWGKGRKKRKVMSQYTERIKSVYLSRGKARGEKEKLLKKLKGEISEEMGRGNIEESVYTILDKKIDDCLEELEETG